MAGKRQHFIPRFLQRGFIMEGKRKDYTWKYEPGANPVPQPINNVGLEGMFYSNEGDNTLDDEITKYEENICQIINIIRSGGSIEAVEDDLPLMIAHFEGRSQNFRRNFYMASESLLKAMMTRFFDDGGVKDVLLSRLNHPSFIDKQINTVLSNLPIDDKSKILIRDNAIKYISKNYDSFLNSAIKVIEVNFRAEVNKRLKQVIKNGHVKGLLNLKKDSPRVNLYGEMNFKVIQTDYNLILGDSMVIFENTSQQRYVPSHDIKYDLLSVCLPVSSNTILYGSVNDKVKINPEMNEQIAKCSMSFFISSKKDDDLVCLQKYIGENCMLLGREEIQSILDEAINEQITTFEP